MNKCQYQVFVEITGKGEEGMSTPEATSPAYPRQAILRKFKALRCLAVRLSPYSKQPTSCYHAWASVMLEQGVL
jgi:hypothetical protein